jgi:hypothetical protein
MLTRSEQTVGAPGVNEAIVWLLIAVLIAATAYAVIQLMDKIAA